MAQKNFAGITCALAILLFAFDAARFHWAVRAGVAAAAAFFLLKTGSQTSTGMCAAGLAAGAGFGWIAARMGRQRLAPPAMAWVLLAVPTLVFVSMAIDNAPFLQMVSDPDAFTGRTQIWTALIKAYSVHPVFGIGYGSFWDLGPSGPIFRYATGWVTQMSEGHDGYLDLLVQVGIVGTLLVLFATLVWPTQRLLAGGNHPTRTMCAALIVFCLGHNFTESMLFDRDALVEVFLMVAIALLWTVTASPASGPAPRLWLRRAAPKPARPRAPLRL